MTGKRSQTLGEIIQDARVDAKLGLRELARELNITPSYLSDIENDRRVPAEDVLRRIADRLRLDFDDLMALAGRFGDRAERYIKRHPVAGTLFRKITENNLGDEELKKLLDKAKELGGEKEGES